MKKIIVLGLLSLTLITGCNQDRAIESSEQVLLDAGYTNLSYIGLGVPTFSCPRTYIRADKFKAIAPTGQLKNVAVCRGGVNKALVVQN